MKSQPPEKKEGQGDEVGDFDTDESASEVVAQNRLFRVLQVVGGEGEGEDHARDDEEDLDAKVSLRDEEVGEVGEDGEPAGFRKSGGSDGLVAGTKEMVPVEKDNENDGEAAETIDFRNISA